MFAFLYLFTTSQALGGLCTTAGFLVIVASVVFVLKGKAVLGDSGAPNVVEWGKIKANLTSALALFVLGAVMILLPFLRFKQEEDRHDREVDSRPPVAILKSDIGGLGGKNVRLLLVVKPDYDQIYQGSIEWEIPLLAGKSSYSVIYTQEGMIIGEQSFSVRKSFAGSSTQNVLLPPLDLQISKSGAEEISARDVTPQLEISNEEVKKKLSIH